MALGNDKTAYLAGNLWGLIDRGAWVSDATGAWLSVLNANETIVGPSRQTSALGVDLNRQVIIAAGPGSTCVAVWRRLDASGSTTSLVAQRFDATGAPIGSEIVIATFGTQPPFVSSLPGVDVDNAGNILVTWLDEFSITSDIHIRRYAPDGTMTLNLLLPGSLGMTQYNPLIAADGAGNFAVAWQRQNGDGTISLLLQHYNSLGQIQGQQIAVATTSYFNGADLAMDDSGNTVAVWSDGAAGGAAITGAFYDASGRRLGRPIAMVQADDGHTLWYPSVAMDSTGDLLLSWQSVDGRGIAATMARRFAPYQAPN